MALEQPPPLPRARNVRRLWILAVVVPLIGIALFMFVVPLIKPTIGISEIKICPRPQPIMDDGYGSIRIAAKVSNASKKPIVLPSFYVRVRSTPEIISNCKTGILLAPGKSCYIVTGGISYYPYGILGASTVAELTFTGNDWYAAAAYVDYELKYRPFLKLITVSTTYIAENSICVVKAHFENQTNKTIASIEGTVVFLDKNGRVVDAYPFSCEPRSDETFDISVFDVPGAAEAQQCVLQIDTFTDTSQPRPNFLPSIPSVH